MLGESVTYITDVKLHNVRLWIAQRVVEAIHTDSIAVKTILRAIDGENRRPGVRFCNPPIALHDNQLGPNFIVNLFPFVENFQYVILQGEETESDTLVKVKEKIKRGWKKDRKG